MRLHVHTRAFHLPLRASLGTAHGRKDGIEGLLVLVRDGLGHLGLGEVTALPDFGTESLAEADSLLRGVRLDAPPETLEDVAVALGPLEGARAARAGLEMALLDVLARRRGVAVARLLGAGAVHPVRVNALLRGETPAEAAGEAEAAVAAGFSTLKLKVGGGSAALDEARLGAVRAAVGPTVRLRVDANAAWTEAEARLRLPRLTQVGLEYVEQPVPAGDVAGLRRLRALVPVAADEALGPPGAATALLDGNEGPAADVLILKLPVLGGLLPALALARRAEARGVGTVVTSALDGAVARAAGAHLALALAQGNRFAHGLATGALLREDRGAHPVVAGTLQLQDVAGLGVEPEAVGW